MELLADLLPDSHLAGFLLQPRTSSPENGDTHSGLGHSVSINYLFNYKDNLPQTCPLVNLILAVS